MARRVFSSLMLLFVAGVVALGYGAYVYHAAPVIVWGLLFLCWACYRLRMRAMTLFGQRKPRLLLNEPESPGQRLQG